MKGWNIIDTLLLNEFIDYAFETIRCYVVSLTGEVIPSNNTKINIYHFISEVLYAHGIFIRHISPEDSNDVIYYQFVSIKEVRGSTNLIIDDESTTIDDYQLVDIAGSIINVRRCKGHYDITEMFTNECSGDESNYDWLMGYCDMMSCKHLTNGDNTRVVAAVIVLLSRYTRAFHDILKYTTSNVGTIRVNTQILNAVGMSMSSSMMINSLVNSLKYMSDNTENSMLSTFLREIHRQISCLHLGTRILLNPVSANPMADCTTSKLAIIEYGR